MRKSFRSGIFRASVLLALAVGPGVNQPHAADAPAQTAAAPPAYWVQRKLNYTYMGFTTQYSCDGLVDNVRVVLLALGARRSDLRIQSTGCTSIAGRPERSPGVTASFWVLAPAPDAIGRAGYTAAHPAQWQTVDLVRLRQFAFEQGQCELLEQLKDQALPLFTSRNLKFRSACVPHQISPGDIQFAVDVLRLVRAKPGAAPEA